MANVSRRAVEKAVAQSLPSSKKWMAGSLMRKAGMDPHHTASVKGYEAQRLMKKLQPQFKAGAQHLTERELGAQIKKADAPTGPSKAAAKMNIYVMRKQRADEDAEKQAITDALSRKAPANDNARGAPKVAPPVQLGGGVIAKAAADASHGDRAGGSFSSSDSIERAETPLKPVPPPKTPEEPYDGYPE